MTPLFYYYFTNLFLFQTQESGRFKFFRINHPFHFDTSYHHYNNPFFVEKFNKTLPPEVIFKILSYLKAKDLIHLCISKLFSPILLNYPLLYTEINNYLLHCLATLFYQEKNNLFVLCTCRALIYKENFYFAIDRSKIKYFLKFFSEYHLFSHVIRAFPSIFLSFQQYEHQFKKLNPLQHFTECQSQIFCICSACHYPKIFQINNKKDLLKRQCNG